MTLLIVGLILPLWLIGYRRGWVRDRGEYAVAVAAKRMGFAMIGVLSLVALAVVGDVPTSTFLGYATPMLLAIFGLLQIGYRPRLVATIAGDPQRARTRIPLFLTAVILTFWWSFVALLQVSNTR